MSRLYNTNSPLSREERINVNNTWQDILLRFANLQRQINILAGGEEVDVLLQRLNQAVDKANTTVQQAIETNNTTLQEAVTNISQKLEAVNKAIKDVNSTKKGALDATEQVQTALNAMQSLITNMSPRGIWNDKTQYYKNNMVIFKGSTFIALQNNLGKTPPTLPTQTNAYWSLLAEKGATGAQGLPGKDGKDGKDGTGVNIIGELRSENDRPSTGSPGDAYLIKGNLHVWQVNINGWKNVGPIQGPQGKSAYELFVENGFQGTMEQWMESLKGSPGPPGKTADLSAYNQQIGSLQKEIDTHVNNSVVHSHFVRAKQEADGTFNVTIPTISAYVPGLRILLRPSESNKQGVVKLNINNLGPKSARYQTHAGYLEEAGILEAMKVYEFIYNAGYFYFMGIPLISDALDSPIQHTVASSNAVKQLNDVKANKKLPSRVLCTLNAGWIHENDNRDYYSPLTYYKDDFGIVHLQGTIKEDIRTRIKTPSFTKLPVGFRPSTTLAVPCYVKGLSNTFIDEIYINTRGDVFSDALLDGVTITCSFRTD